MKKLQNLIGFDHETFGPGTDLIVSLVAVLLIMLGINSNAYKQKLLDLEIVRKNQMDIVHKIAAEYNTKAREISRDKYAMGIERSTSNDIIIENDVTIQRIAFSSNILFDSDEHLLKKRGKEILTNVGNIFKLKLDAISEIQIQGHADNQKTQRYDSNLELAAKRAIQVFEFLVKLNIEPTRHIMSVTSFGEFKPVQRKYSDNTYNETKLKLDNKTEKQRALNRRIEIVLIYKRKD